LRPVERVGPPLERELVLFDPPLERELVLFDPPLERELVLFDPPLERELVLFDPPLERELVLFERERPDRLPELPERDAEFPCGICLPFSSAMGPAVPLLAIPARGGVARSVRASPDTPRGHRHALVVMRRQRDPAQVDRHGSAAA
jgi:hypothetical protein